MLKRIVSAVAALGIVAASAASCGDPHDISLKSYDLASLTLNGLRGVDAILSLEIDNPSVRIDVSEIGGQLRKGDKPIAHFIAEPFTLKARSTQTYTLPCTITLDPGVSLMDVISIVGKGLSDDLKVDISAQGSHGPVHKTVSRSDVPLKSFVK